MTPESERKGLVAELHARAANYRAAPSGDGPNALDWADKPHRVLYDACADIEVLLGLLSSDRNS